MLYIIEFGAEGVDERRERRLEAGRAYVGNGREVWMPPARGMNGRPVRVGE